MVWFIFFALKIILLYNVVNLLYNWILVSYSFYTNLNKRSINDIFTRSELIHEFNTQGLKLRFKFLSVRFRDTRIKIILRHKHMIENH